MLSPIKSARRIAAVGAAVLLPLRAKATDLGGGLLQQTGAKAKMSDAPIETVVGTVINAFLSVLGVLFLAYLVYGGYIWMTSAGDETKVKKATDIIRNSIIGLIIVVAAYAITFFVLSRVLEKTAP
jgi:amino acid transporter